MKKLLFCALAGAVVAQVWGMISWMVLPWHDMAFRQFQDQDVVVEALRSQTQGAGLYTLPNMDPTVHQDEAKMSEWNSRAKNGPFAFMAIVPDGVEPGMGLPMALGFLANVAIAAILFMLMGKTTVTGDLGQAGFIAAAGTVGAIYPYFANWNWWHFPLGYSLVGVVDLTVTWGLAGLAMVKLSHRLG